MRASARRLLLLWVVAAGVLVATSPRVDLWLARDSCLDRGGSFDYTVAACDFERSHPYLPDALVPPWISPAGAATALVIVLSGLGAFAWHARRRA